LTNNDGKSEPVQIDGFATALYVLRRAP
jgi:hypothetical protein